METATVDGITSTSASESSEQIIASLSHDAGAIPESSEPAREPAKPAGKRSIQARIDDLTAQVQNKDQAISTLNAKLGQIDALERKLAALESRPAAERPPDRPEPARQDDEPTEDQFENYKDFVKAQAKWEIRQELHERDRQQAQRQHAETRQSAEAARHESFSQRLEAARASLPNFDAVLASEIRLSLPMQDVIKDSEIGPQLMVYLHEHPEEADRIYRAGPQLRVFAEMNKLEARLEAAVDRGPAPSAKPVSRAKPPIKPLGAASSATSDGPPGDDASAEEHFRYWDRVEADKMKQGR